MNDSIPVVVEEDIPPPPPTDPASPRAMAAALEPLFERVIGELGKRFEAVEFAIETLDRRVEQRFELLEKKQAARHKLVINRIAKVERTLADHEARLRALETTRIVVRGLVEDYGRRRRRARKTKR